MPDGGGDHTALIMPGGGARAAYQVGVLKGLAALQQDTVRNPYPILCGTSAGAINAVALASQMHNFQNAVAYLEELWLGLSTDQIYRSDWAGVMGNAWRLVMSLFNDGIAVGRPVSLLDNAPLQSLLAEKIDFDQIGRNIRDGHLSALSITAMNYTEGHSVSFFQGGPKGAGWQRWRRQGVPTLIQLQHLMASTAIPTLFKPQRIGPHFYGDGALRQLAPISPALHLGATRAIIIPPNGHRQEYHRPIRPIHSPSFGQIIGHLLNSAFVDSIETDIERLVRINELIRRIPEEARTGYLAQFKPIDAMIISPSQDIDLIADDHISELPRTVRTFMRTTGSGRNEAGVNIGSYLLFTRNFCKELIELGYKDALAQGEEIQSFIAGTHAAPSITSATGTPTFTP